MQQHNPSGDIILDYRPPDSDIATHRIAVTYFENEKGQWCKAFQRTLPELRDEILQTRERRTKKDTFWLKLATFGKKRSKNNCLRWNPNVESISGVELDYDGALDADGKLVSFDQAVAILKDIKVRALIYTSASHTANKPRWRLLIPLSWEEARLHMREKYVARINGRFGRIFADESFCLARAIIMAALPTTRHRITVAR